MTRSSITPGWYLRVKEGRTRSLYRNWWNKHSITWFYRSVVAKRDLSNTAKLSIYKSVFVPILTTCYESWVDRKSAISSTGSSDFCNKFTTWLFSEQRDTRYDGSATWSECPRKEWQGKSCWLAKQNFLGVPLNKPSCTPFNFRIIANCKCQYTFRVSPEWHSFVNSVIPLFVFPYQKGNTTEY